MSSPKISPQHQPSALLAEPPSPAYPEPTRHAENHRETIIPDPVMPTALFSPMSTSRDFNYGSLVAPVCPCEPCLILVVNPPYGSRGISMCRLCSHHPFRFLRTGTLIYRERNLCGWIPQPVLHALLRGDPCFVHQLRSKNGPSGSPDFTCG